MNFQIIYRKNNFGFTLIELIIVVFLFVLFAGISQVAFFNFQTYGNLNTITVNLVEALRYAKSNAQQVQSDTKWGVKINSSEAVIFSGDSYDTRNISEDKTLSLSASISFSGLSEVVFEKVSGNTSNIGNIVLLLGDQSKTISINEKGTISY